MDQNRLVKGDSSSGRTQASSPPYSPSPKYRPLRQPASLRRSRINSFWLLWAKPAGTDITAPNSSAAAPSSALRLPLLSHSSSCADSHLHQKHETADIAAIVCHRTGTINCCHNLTLHRSVNYQLSDSSTVLHRIISQA